MSGFPGETFRFLEELADNNSRDWFADNKGRYEDLVRTPALALIESVGEQLHEISPYFRADARKMGGSLMRIYRDSRFSRDKAPYKTNIGIQFRHEVGKDVHAPGYYLHISAAECFVGVGIWHPPSDALYEVRDLIANEPDLWLAARDDPQFSRWFRLAGDSLKTAPRGFDRTHPMIDDIKRKDFIALSDLAPALIEQEELADIVCDYFKAGESLMRFLCRAQRLPFQQ